jgi:thiamine-phosphate pyrophosphorylase
MARDAVMRLLDVSLNRAREAARCAEDYARFVAVDPASARALKGLRQCLGGLGRRIPLSARDVPGDALRDHTPEAEVRRDTPGDVATASLKRLQEALRTLEEYGKLVDQGLSRAAKRLRFEAYLLESALTRHPASAALKRARLYAVLSPDLIPGDPYRSAVQALRGGVDLMQLRCKGPGWPDRAVLRLADRIGAQCRRAGVPFFLNDRLDLALACGADGVHVGQSDLTLRQVRALAGRRLLIGISTHTSRQIAAACRAPTDYLAVGPVFPTLTKPRRGAVGLALLKALPAGAPPVFAIGGITRENLPRVRRAGAARVAVTGAVFRAPDIRAAVRALRRALPAGAP